MIYQIVGSTVFIEPISIFEMNNELNKLNIDEQLEIENILKELSTLFAPYTEELKLDCNLIGKLDFIFAKAKYAKSIKAVIPNINTSKQINLVNARHPLINPNSVVPISINLGKNFIILLITGPNAGGKTVCLKTVGLLTCMACSGMAIPCDENSSIYVFDYIFADIGDNQSISDSLSTFSAHISNIVNIIKKATSNSLVLVDELGSGTDPLEGANLAISILDYFKNLNCLTIATTHYQELKQYSLVTNGFENASVEFDINTLSPTYHLLIGIPGKSNAFDISKKLGLNDEIIKKAKSFMTNQQINIEELLKNIYDNKALIEKQKDEISKQLDIVNNLKESLEKENDDVKKKHEILINNAKINARNILLDAKEEATKIIKEMEKLSDTKKLNNLRNDLNEKIKNIKMENTSYSDTLNTTVFKPNEIVPNMDVFVRSLNKNGVVTSYVSKSNEVQVQFGNLKVNVKINDLAKPIYDKNSSNVSDSNYTHIQKSKNIKTEINVIGLNVEEAIFVIDKFLDDCSIAKLKTARIVHGKGTGKLRNRYS